MDSFYGSLQSSRVDPGKAWGSSAADSASSEHAQKAIMDSEQEFHNKVRAILVFFIFFFFFYLLAHNLVTKLKRRPDREDYFPDDESSRVYIIPYFLCTFSLATSAAVICLLPVSIVSNEVLIRYPNNYYMQWLNSSLIFMLWNKLFFMCNLNLFLLLPFAYFFTESEGLPGSPRTIWAKVYETIVSLFLLTVVVIGLVMVGSAIANFDQLKNHGVLLGIWNYYFPLLYSFISMIGALLHLFCTPRGFSKMFTVMGKILTKPQFLHDIAQDRDTVVLEQEYLRRKIEELCGKGALEAELSFTNPDLIYTQLHSNHCSSSKFCRKDSKPFANVPKTSGGAGLNGSRVGFDEMIQKYREKSEEAKELNRRLSTPQWRRNLGYPLMMLFLLLMTSLCAFMVGINAIGLVFGNASLPFVENENSTAFGKDSLSRLGWFGAALEITLTFYFVLSSLIGFYSLPWFKKLLPKYKDTPLHIIIINCIFMLVVSSALPLVMRTLGLTNFDLIGSFGRMKWLRNLTHVLVYNVCFTSLTGWCLVHTFTAAIRHELYLRLLALQDQIYWSYCSAYRCLTRPRKPFAAIISPFVSNATQSATAMNSKMK